ncbi:hypothetical protein GKC29_02195 [Micromonospora sp. WMMC415]|uniref:hypothetical protein n=1 Tax=Micromonospora sp. WMMC415 TaxID=2675222 RepID=UPI0012B47256|nr:hypothetical protein [Micromonospora sp. WMMC415]QGN45782.1 hypothetical protein GKC29_02195 [Micromonospora sp. WMMC415]
METWRFVAAVMTSLTMGLIGVALATNFRGVTEWHVRRSMATAGVLRRVPPWRRLPDARYDKHMARFVLLERVIGVVFAAAGVMFLIVLGYGILSGEPIRPSR